MSVANYISSQVIRVVAPLSEYGIDGPARLVVYDHRARKFALIKEIAAQCRFSIQATALGTHLDHSFKLQVKSEGRWVDHIKYKRVVEENVTDEGIKYLFFPQPASQHLIVIFQAINTTPAYNYIRTLAGVPAHRLYIKDDYGSDAATRSSYYLGSNRTFAIANATQSLIRQTVDSLGLKPIDCVFAGSSKGGFAALFHGYRFGAGHVLPGGPQVLLGNFLGSKSKDSVHPPILKYLSGGTDNNCIEWANGLLFSEIAIAKPPLPKVIVHVGKDEPHYRGHVLPLAEYAVKHRLDSISLDLADYATHEELAKHYPIFLRKEVDKIIPHSTPDDSTLTGPVQMNAVLPYEDISNIDPRKAALAAEQILANGWLRREYPLIRLGDPIPWALESQKLRSWNFHIHCWDMLNSLLKAHSVTGDEKFLVTSIRVAGEWVDAHSDSTATDISPFAWYDMSVGLRSYRLAYILDAGEAAGLLDSDLRTKLWNSLLQHVEYLADDSNIAFHNNHGYYQIAGQVAVGRRFAHVAPKMGEALALGQERLQLMLKQQFATDGVHREHSPDYHRMVYDTLKALIDAGLVSDPKTVAFAQLIERALSWFVLPNQHIVNFGDSDLRRVARFPAEAQRKWATEEMRYVASGGKIGTLPPNDFVAFEEGGYFVVRRPSPEAPSEFRRSSYLAQTAAFHSRTHKHADDLSFIWSDRGNDLLVDAGRYGYIGKAEQGSDLWLDGHWYSDPNRVYCESTRAHNTLEFNGLNYPRKGAKPYGSALNRWVKDESEGVFAVETLCRHFRSIRRARVLVFKPAQWLVVFDWFHDNDQATHTAKQWFHLAPHLQLNEESGAYSISVPTSPQPLRAVSLLEGVTASRPYLAESEPHMQGWWSGTERDIVPAYAFCHEMTGTTEGSIATLFSFSNELTVDKDWSRVNVSGRKAQFRWTDEAGKHELMLDRAEDLPTLGLKYSVRTNS